MKYIHLTHLFRSYLFSLISGLWFLLFHELTVHGREIRKKKKIQQMGNLLNIKKENM